MPDEPRTLLRKLLKRAEALSAATNGSDPLPLFTSSAASTFPAAAAPTNAPDAVLVSPVRPIPPPSEPTPPTEPIPPNPRVTQVVDLATLPPTITTLEDRLKAETALEQLREKTAAVAAEFSQGKINRAQFLALYAHYNEKREIIEKLLARDPDTNAWQSVAKPGNTTFLRAHFEARVLSYTIYEQKPPNTGQVLTTQGKPPPDPELAGKIIKAIGMVVSANKPLQAQRKEIDNGRWLIFAPGEFTTAMGVFSLEPSNRQLTLIQDIHRDFEKANRPTLARGIRALDQLVFPHRALFNKGSEGA